MQDINKYAGAQLRALRKQRGVTLKQLARVCGISYQQIQKYEVRNNALTAERLCQISRFFSVSADYFFPDASDE